LQNFEGVRSISKMVQGKGAKAGLKSEPSTPPYRKRLEMPGCSPRTIAGLSGTGSKVKKINHLYELFYCSYTKAKVEPLTKLIPCWQSALFQ
jgi:hypothetical protein